MAETPDKCQPYLPPTDVQTPTPVPAKSHPGPAGWYTDPEREAPYRYWNGDRWTGRTRDTKPIDEATAAALAGCAGVAIGSLGPWLSSGPASVSGVSNGSDGIYTLLGALAAAGCIGIYLMKQADESLFFAFVIGLGCIFTGVVDISSINSQHDMVFGTDVAPSAGWGIWLMLGSSIGFTAALAWHWWTKRDPGRRIIWSP